MERAIISFVFGLIGGNFKFRDKVVLVLEGTVQSSGIWVQLKAEAEQFICSCAQKSSRNFDKTSRGLLWFLPWKNMQYVSTATFAMSVYSKYLSANNESLNCDGTTVTPLDLTSLVRDQRNIHCINKKRTKRQGGFDAWFNKDTPNPNVLEGAVVGPDRNDNYVDRRDDYQLAEPTTVTNAPLLGVLAFLA
ncbi:hypothetical protein PIB30_060976 [Stylosanthes scabra]|uniref:Endoglucanase n=1 Tax=Stylosanthes scabra TaxID=79078 RepID=A0ABU6TLD6_9FABA|nr:hypothetical protein [Stylosanthes scabra]